MKNSASPVSLGAAGLAVTDPKHITGGGSAETAGNMPTDQQKFTYEVNPSGNAVILEEQLLKMSQNFTDYQFTANLYQKNIQMLKEALK